MPPGNKAIIRPSSGMMVVNKALRPCNGWLQTFSHQKTVHRSPALWSECGLRCWGALSRWMEREEIQTPTDTPKPYLKHRSPQELWLDVFFGKYVGMFSSPMFCQNLYEFLYFCCGGVTLWSLHACIVGQGIHPKWWHRKLITTDLVHIEYSSYQFWVWKKLTTASLDFL